MAIDIFMRIDGITGESKDAHHKNWIDVHNFTWGASQPNTLTTGGGGGAGKVNFQDLKVTAAIDKAAPTILKHSAIGRHIPKLEISVCKAGGEQIEYSRITLDDVMVTGVEFDGSKNNEVLWVTYSFQAVKIKTQYWEQTERGGKGPETQMGYDIKQNKATT
jgi:type VI secretion system secreted protein Hcp